MGEERKRWKAAEGRGMKQSVLIHIVFGGVYILVSVVNFLFGVVPFPPVEPDLTAVFWRVLFAGLWLALGLWGSALLKSKWSLVLLLPPALIMILHGAGAAYLFSMPLSEILHQDKYLYAAMAFVFSGIQLIALTIKAVADARIGKSMSGQQSSRRRAG